jgi:hypothetical protein
VRILTGSAAIRKVKQGFDQLKQAGTDPESINSALEVIHSAIEKLGSKNLSFLGRAYFHKTIDQINEGDESSSIVKLAKLTFGKTFLGYKHNVKDLDEIIASVNSEYVFLSCISPTMPPLTPLLRAEVNKINTYGVTDLEVLSHSDIRHCVKTMSLDVKGFSMLCEKVLPPMTENQADTLLSIMKKSKKSPDVTKNPIRIRNTILKNSHDSENDLKLLSVEAVAFIFAHLGNDSPDARDQVVISILNTIEKHSLTADQVADLKQSLGTLAPEKVKGILQEKEAPKKDLAKMMATKIFNGELEGAHSFTDFTYSEKIAAFKLLKANGKESEERLLKMVENHVLTMFPGGFLEKDRVQLLYDELNPLFKEADIKGELVKILNNMVAKY